VLTEVLKIQPKLDDKELNKMEKSLGSRFARIAKGFGRGLKLASVAALGAAVLDKLVNPLNEVKQAIDRTLGKADDIVTNAKQFNTSTENLLKLRALGNVRGVTNENIDLLLTKFQGAVAQAKQNPNDPNNSAVRNYIGENDTAKAFYNFILQLQKMDKNQQVLVQQQVFGEKQILKMAEFLQDTGFQESAKSLEKVNFAKAAKGAESLAELNDRMAANRTVNELRDLTNKAAVIDRSTIANVNQSEINALRRENGRIGRSAQAFTAEERMAEIQDNVEKLTTELITQLPILMDGLNTVVDLLRKSVEGWRMIFDLLKNSTIVRGIKGWFGSKDGD
jgi:hypothetical protein